MKRSDAVNYLTQGLVWPNLRHRSLEDDDVELDQKARFVGVDYLSHNLPLNCLDLAFTYNIMYRRSHPIIEENRSRILNVLKRTYALKCSRQPDSIWEYWAEPVTCGNNLCSILYIHPLNVDRQELLVKKPIYSKLKSCLKQPYLTHEFNSNTFESNTIPSCPIYSISNQITPKISRIVKSESNYSLEKCSNVDFDFEIYIGQFGCIKSKDSRVSFDCTVNQARIPDDDFSQEYIAKPLQILSLLPLKIDTVFEGTAVYFMSQKFDNDALGTINSTNALILQHYTQLNPKLIQNWMSNYNERAIMDAPLLELNGEPNLKSMLLDFIAETYCKLLSPF